MSKFIVIRDCWRWALVDDDGKPIQEGEHAYPTKDLILQDLEQYGKPGHPDVVVEVWDGPLARVEPEGST